MKTKKTLLILVKIFIAAALMAWVLSDVAMRRHVVDAASGEKLPVETLLIKSGGDFQLIDPDGNMASYPEGSFAKVDAQGPAQSDNFVRPGLLDVLDSIKFIPMAAGMFLLGLSYCVGTWRWWALVNSAGLELNRLGALKLTWLGLFFNNVILGTTGGDIAKVFALSRGGHSRTESLLTVMADRIFGLFSLVLLAGISVCVMLLHNGSASFNSGFYSRLKLAAIAIGAAFGALGAGACIVMRLSGDKPVPQWLSGLLEKFRMDKRLALASGIFRLYGKSPAIIPAAILRSMLMQCLFICSIWQLSAAIGLFIPLSRFVLFIPLIYMIAAVPVTPGAVGVVEGLYAGFFAGLAGPSELLILALMVRLAIVVWALPGVFGLLGKDRQNK